MSRCLVAFLLSAALTFTQTNRGGIAGTVSDAMQAAVPNASVIITNQRTNEVRTLSASRSGAYTASDLEPVEYRVEVAATGFRKTVIDNVKVNTATTTNLDVTLELGALDTKVTVRAEVALVNTESGTTGGTITEREIRDVPLVNRSVLDLATTMPNVSGDPGTENPSLVTATPCPGCNLSVNGGRPLSTLMMADGTNNTGISLARTMVSFSPETVQEFTVETTNYSAEYGTTGGGVINATTKSGSNQFNGTALWYNRNPDFSAAPFTQAATNRPVPTLKYNQFSLTAGGPVWLPKIYNGENSTFWFAAFEPNYRRDRLDQYALVPTDAMRQGDFSGMVNTASGWLPQSVVDQFRSVAPAAVTPLSDSAIYNQYSVTSNQFSPITLAAGASYTPFPNNLIPKTMVDSSAHKALAFIAEPGSYFVNSNGLISNLFSPRLLSQDDKRYTLRVDHVISDRNRIYGRYTSTPLVKIQFTPVSITTGGAEYSWAKQIMLADTHTISPTVFNDLRLNHTRGRFSSTTSPQYDATTGENLNTLFGLPNITKGGVPSFGGLFPGSSLGGGSSTATGIGSGASTNQEDREERYAVTDILYLTKGSMSWKFGVDVSHSLQNVIPLFAALGGQYGFSANQTNSNGTSSGTGGNAFASFLLGVPNANVTLRNAEVPYYYRWNSAAAFVQNDWKVRPNLTLNLGLRYNLEMPRTEKYNDQGVFRLDMAQEVPLPTPLMLQNGEVVTSTLVPPFVFAGRGGNSRYLTPADYTDFEPRFGFAWSPAVLRSHHVTLRGGYGISHVPVTGSFRLPQPDFGATQGFASTVPSTTANPNVVMRLGENPPVLNAQPPALVVGAPADGIVYQNSVYYQQGIGGFAISSNYHTPYIQNWSFTISWQLNNTTSLEIGYAGLKGTHLFLPHENINPKDVSLLNAQIAQNVNTTATIADPLGRVNPSTGRPLTVQNGSLGSPYLGFSSLYVLYDAAANSIRHAGYVNILHRVSRGLTFSANYTYAKSIDDASSGGGDKNVLTAVNGQVDGQIAFGGTRRNDRAVSSYDQRDVLNGTYIYDLPFGRGRRFLSTTGKPIQFVAAGWTTSGVIHLNSGFPYMPSIADTNLIGDLTHTIRPDLVPGQPLINPLWDRNCPTGSGCQPYLNPSAFARPPLGALGTAPRTLDGARGPWAQFFDASIQKDFPIGERRRIQFRVDALNAFNHPVFRVFPNNAGGTDMFNSAPSTATLSAADYDTWAAANSQPPAGTAAGGALLAQINSMVATQRNAAGVLPNDFFSMPLPADFWGHAATSYDITTLKGYKLFRMRQAYNPAFGDLYSSTGQPRFIQFGIKIFF